MRNETVRDVMAATRCSVLMFRRVYCMPSLASSMDGVANIVAECPAVGERLIFQFVSKTFHFSSKKSLSTKVGILSRMTNLALRDDEWEEYCYETHNASPTSSIDGVVGMVAAWFSLGERLTLQSVSRTFRGSWNTNWSAECGTLEDDSGALLSDEWDQYCCETQRNAFALRSSGIVVLIRKTAFECAKRCEVCIEVGSSPSLPNSNAA